jgi:FkbM family methyltransferase
MPLAEFVYTTVLKPRPLRSLANAIILSLLPESTRVGPATICLNPKDPVLSGALAFRVFERSEIRFFTGACTKGMTVVDVGANAGLYTALAMHLTGPQGRVVAVEPHAESRGYLERTVAANRTSETARVDIVARAAGDKEGEGRLFPNPNNKGDNRTYASDLTPASDAANIKMVRLDAVLAKLGISRIDFLKIDIQGAELAAIRGATGTIKSSPKMIMLTEFWPDGLRRAGADPMDYLQLLQDLGFRIRDLNSDDFLTSRTDFQALITQLPGRKYTNLIGSKA